MRGLIAAAGLTLLLIGGAAVWYHRTVNAPGPGIGTAVVEIPRGAPVRRVARILAGAGVVGDPLPFELAARLSGVAERIHAGEYELSRSASVRETLATLVEGKALLHPVTFVEGLTLREMAAAAEATGLWSPERFVAAAADPALIRHHGIPAANLEGYLFPDTYRFPRSATEREVVAAMVETFFARIAPLPEAEWRDPEARHRLVTLASLVEKETALDEERPLVASVYVNRLARGMRLQCDPTVIYALPEFDGNLRRADLSYDSPYNTYRYRGLPPGPIANPGLASLAAAASPAESGYLYFVAKGPGEPGHQFSTTLAAHNAAVRRYQLGGKNGVR